MIRLPGGVPRGDGILRALFIECLRFAITFSLVNLYFHYIQPKGTLCECREKNLNAPHESTATVIKSLEVHQPSNASKTNIKPTFAQLPQVYDIYGPSPKPIKSVSTSIHDAKASSNSTMPRSKNSRGIYGGKEGEHLGGFLERDESGISPNTWNFMIGILGVKSIVDIGCGRGWSTRYFMERGVDVLCVEGSHDAVVNSVLPQER
jgi:hypothetical protein